MSEPGTTTDTTTGASLAEQIDRAFDYRGYVTVQRRDGSAQVGFIYDRGPAYVEMFDEAGKNRIRIATGDIASIDFSGEDSAAKAQRIWERRMGALEEATTSRWGDWSGGADRAGEPLRPALLVTALPVELRSVARALGGRVHGAEVHGQLGRASAIGVAVGVGGGAAHAVAAERPSLVISCGFAGALAPGLATGDVVLASSVCDETGEVATISDRTLRTAEQAFGDASVAVRIGEILCATQVAGTAEAKRALGRPGRLAVDLESWAVAQAAVRAGIPWLAIRVIIDPVELELPPFTRVSGHATRGGYVGAALRHALGGPRAALELFDLARRARTASRSLERAIAGLRHFALPHGPLTGPQAEPRS